MDGLIPGYYDNIRKRACSSSPSKVHNYRFKQAIMVGRTRLLGGSRSSTPASSWKITPASKFKPVGRVDSSREPVSARKLAATLWEVNEIPAAQNLEKRRVRDKHSHLSDPSHTPVSERINGSRKLCRLRTTISNHAKIGEVFDSHSNTSLVEIETRSVNGINPRLKEASNALTTSKQLLKIVHRICAHDNLPSSSMSLISALDRELERASIQVNHIAKDRPDDHTEVNNLLKRFVGELEVEKKLRQRSESLNKKLGLELAETKASFGKVLKELECEKRAREIMERVCNELAVDIGQDLAEFEELKRESVKVCEEVEKEREMLQIANKLREERVQMKLAEAKHQFEEKTAVVDQLRSQLESVLGNKVTGKKTGRKDKDLMKCLRNSDFSGARLNEEHDDCEVEDDKDSWKSDLHSNKSCKWRISVKGSVNGLVNGNGLRRSSCSIQKSISDGNEWCDLQKYKSVKGLRDRILTNLKSRDFDYGRRSKS